MDITNKALITSTGKGKVSGLLVERVVKTIELIGLVDVVQLDARLPVSAEPGAQRPVEGPHVSYDLFG